MSQKLSNCPDSQTLVDFLLGKLGASEIEDCQRHIANCAPCVDTIHGLKTDDDTLDGLARDAWIASTERNGGQDEAQVVDELINRLGELSGHSLFDTPSKERVLQDRAAEVQRVMERPTIEGDLGRIGKYRVLEILGAGSTGVVYHAIDDDLDRAVAIKILRPSLGELARQRFMAEAKATAMLSHPNIVTIYEVGIEGPLAYISMKWEPGQTLEQLLAQQNQLPVQQTRQLGTQLAEALAHAHQCGLIHRDIKPANVWIPDEHGVAACKVLDFGLVRITDEDPQLTCTGIIAGTPCYMSPEQSRGQQLDGRSDLFSLGCVLYQSLAGRLPFRSDNALSTLQSIQRDQPVALQEIDSSISGDLSDLVLCLLEKSPDRRPPNASSVVVALTSDRSDWPFEVSLSAPHVAKPQAKRNSSVRNWKLAAALLTLLTLGTVGFLFAPDITKIVTNQGTIEIESQVDDVQIEILQNGSQVRVVDLSTEQSIVVKAGVYEIRPLGDQNSVSIANKQLTLKRGQKEIVTITQSEAVKGQLLSSAESDEIEQQQPLKVDVQSHRIGVGDVLGVFVEGVLGDLDSMPPVHFPSSESGLPVVAGYPIFVDDDGNIALPLIKPILVKGKTVDEARKLLVAAYKAGDTPILPKELLISLYLWQKGDDSGSPYLVKNGDVLGVYVEGVLGALDESPPIHLPNKASNILLSTGTPILVDESGNLNLPLVKPILVRGKTITQVRKMVEKVYTSGDDPIILTAENRMFVTLMQKSMRASKRGQATLEN